MQAAALVVAVLVIGIGLPLGAVALSRSRRLRQPAPLSWTDRLHLEARRRRLTSLEAEGLTAAVNHGQVAPAELQPFVVELAAAKVIWLEGYLRPSRRARRIRLLIFAAMIVGGVGVALAAGPHRSRLTATTVQVTIQTVLIAIGLRLYYRRQLRLARQAVTVNSSAAAATPPRPTPIVEDHDQ